MKIVADAHIPYIEDYFGHLGKLILKPGREISRQDIKDADILLVRSITRVNESLLAGSTIKFVGSVTAGLDHVDTAYLEANNITWANAAGFNAPAVADYVVAVVAALQRRHLLLQPGLKAAIIGLGNVGRLVEKQLKILGFDVVVCDPIRAENEPGFASTPIEEIADVDLISIHTPLTTSGLYPTAHLINEDFIRRQKQGVVLINTSRGGVLDSQALIKYSSHLCACLDVFEGEPEVSNALMQHAHISTPHIAGYSVQSKMRGIDMVYQAVCQAGWVRPSEQVSVSMPRQTLNFADVPHRWHDVVLGIFNPLIMTVMMQTVLLPVEKKAPLFDRLRHEFDYRYEFAYTDIKANNITQEDAVLLQALGMLI